MVVFNCKHAHVCGRTLSRNGKSRS